MFASRRRCGAGLGFALAVLSASPGCQDAAAPRGSAPGALPFDLGAVVRQVRLAFRPYAAGHRGGHGTYTAEVAGGALTVTPYHHAGCPGRLRANNDCALAARSAPVAGAPVTFRTVSMERGGLVLDAAPRNTVAEPDGTLRLERGPADERFANGEDGVTQSWEFPAEPGHDGGLVIRIEVTGLLPVGQSAGGIHLLDPATGVGLRYGHATWIDAEGARTEVPVRWEGAALRLEVPAETVAGSRYPAMLDPLISPEFGMDVPIMGPAEREQSEPSVAFDGAQYLVVWSDDRWNSTGWIYATRVSIAGEVVDPAGISLPGYSRDPDVAAGARNFLVVWDSSPNDIRGALIDSAGVVAGPFPIVADDYRQARPSAAFDGQNFLVVWEDFRTGAWSIYGAIVSPTGSVLVPDIPISTRTTLGFAPAVAGGAGRFLVVWGPGTYQLLSRDLLYAVLDDSGNIVVPAGNLTTGEVGYQSAGFDGTNFLAVWADGRDRPTSGVDLWGRVIDPAGRLVGAELAVASGPGDQLAPAVGVSGGTWLVAWEDDRDSAFAGNDVYARQLAADGSPLGAEVVVASGIDDQRSPVLAGGGAGYLLAWKAQSQIGVSDIVGAPAAADGALLQPERLLSVAANRQDEPAVACNGSSFLVVFADGRAGDRTSDLYGVRVSLSGAILDPAGIAVATGAGSEWWPRASSNGSDFLVAWTESLDTGRITRVLADGTVPDPVGVPVGSAGEQVVVTSVASNGADYLVAWSRAGDVWAARVQGSTGALLDGGGFQVSTSTGYESATCASDGSGYLLVWSDSRTGDRDVYAARVDATGSVLDPGGVLVASGPGDQAAAGASYGAGAYLVVWRDTTVGSLETIRVDPAGQPLGATTSVASVPVGPAGVAFDGFRHLVVWSQGPSSLQLELRGARVDPAGTVIEPGGFSISAEPGVGYGLGLASDGDGRSLVAYERFDAAAPFGAERVRGRFVDENLALGAPCGSDPDCAGGACVDGVCCDSDCGGGRPDDCLACSVAGGAQQDGTCSVAHAGVVCRESRGPCDVVETCGGAADSCPVDAFAPAGASCRPAAGACDAEEACDGAAAECPEDAFAPAGAPCRSAAHRCDAPEACTGADAACPQDVSAPAGTECRPAAGPCDVAESCTGDGAPCPPDGRVPEGEPCRIAAGPCDLTESCDGLGAECPDDLLATGTECRPAAGPCDAPETCTAGSAACPDDRLAPPGTRCRAAAGPCDRAESCSGSSDVCPRDTFVAAGALCRGAAGPCDTPERCDGATPACPEDRVAADGAACDGGTVCTGAASCEAGACRPGRAPDCDDADPCTSDRCVEPLGCVSTPIPGCCLEDPACDDGDPCTYDACGPNLACLHTEVPGCSPGSGGDGGDGGHSGAGGGAGTGGSGGTGGAGGTPGAAGSGGHAGIGASPGSRAPGPHDGSLGAPQGGCGCSSTGASAVALDGWFGLLLAVLGWRTSDRSARRRPRASDVTVCRRHAVPRTSVVVAGLLVALAGCPEPRPAPPVAHVAPPVAHVAPLTAHAAPPMARPAPAEGSVACRADEDCVASQSCLHCGVCYSVHPAMHLDCAAVCAGRPACACVDGRCVAKTTPPGVPGVGP